MTFIIIYYHVIGCQILQSELCASCRLHILMLHGLGTFTDEVRVEPVPFFLRFFGGFAYTWTHETQLKKKNPPIEPKGIAWIASHGDAPSCRYAYV